MPKKYSHSSSCRADARRLVSQAKLLRIGRNSEFQVERSMLAVAGQKGRGSKSTKTKTTVSRACNLYTHRRRELSYRWAVFKRQAKRCNHEVDLRRYEFAALALRSTCTYCGGTAEYMGLGRVQNDQGVRAW